MPKQVRPVRDTGAEVAKRLQDAREEAGLSYRRLEELTDINYAHARLLLGGKRPMTVDEFILFCAALGLDPIKVLADAIEKVEAAHAPAPVPEPKEPVHIITSVADLPEDDYDYAPGELEALAAYSEPGADDVRPVMLEDIGDRIRVLPPEYTEGLAAYEGDIDAIREAEQELP